MPEDRIFLPTVEDLEASCNEAMDSTDEQHTLPTRHFNTSWRPQNINGSNEHDEEYYDVFNDVDDEPSGNQATTSEDTSHTPTRIFSQEEKTVHDAIYGPKNWQLNDDGTWSIAEGGGGSITI